MSEPSRPSSETGWPNTSTSRSPSFEAAPARPPPRIRPRSSGPTTWQRSIRGRPRPTWLRPLPEFSDRCGDRGPARSSGTRPGPRSLLERRDVAFVEALSPRLQDAAHDLARARLGQLIHELDVLRLS